MREALEDLIVDMRARAKFCCEDGNFNRGDAFNHAADKLEEVLKAHDPHPVEVRSKENDH